MYKFSLAVARWVERFLPSSLVFSILLTLVTAILAFIYTETTIVKVTTGWVSGIGSLMAFAFQTAWGFASGMTFMKAPAVSRVVTKWARTVTTPKAAVLVVALVGGVSMWLNIYVSAFLTSTLVAVFAREIKGTDLRVLTAAAYSSIILFGGGLSGTVPLALNTPNNPWEKLMGGLVPTTATIFSSWNLIIHIGLLASIIVLFYFVHPKKEEDVVSIWHYIPRDDAAKARAEMAAAVQAQPAAVEVTFADKMDNARILNILLALALFGAAGYMFATGGLGALNLTNIGLVLLGLAVLAYDGPSKFMSAFQESVKSMGGIIVEFPLYGGVMGIMTASGLAGLIANWFIQISTAQTLPIYTFLSAGIINMFVPSSGSQWAVQGPVMIPAAMALGASPAKIAMAVTYGDVWTNLIQPFWTLLYLPIIASGTKLRPRDFMGFALPILLVSGVVFIMGLAFL